MGLNVGANVLTSGSLGLATIILVVMGILLVSASNKLSQLDEFESSSTLKKAHSDLKTAYWLIFISAGIGLLLGIAYAGHETAWCPSEWIHTMVFILMYAALIIGFIYAYIALNDIYNPDIDDRNGADGFIWASLLVGAFAFMLVSAAGTGRIGYNAARGDVTHRVRHAEKKIHEMHSMVTGKVNDFVEPVDKCGSCEDPEPPCGKAPVPTMMVMPQDNHTYHVNQGMNQNNGPVRLPQVPQYQTQQSHQFVGPPTVTRHSMVTTSQPSMTTSSPQMSQNSFI